MTEGATHFPAPTGRRLAPEGLALIGLFLICCLFTPAMGADADRPAGPSFRQDIVPALTRFGCSSGGCHGKLAGQNGFRLSLRGFAPEWDHPWITEEVNGRRINPAFPAESLMVTKPTGGVPHEGGTRFRADSRPARALIDWIAARAPSSPPEEAEATRLEVLP